jgi:hypothetical protein
MTGAAIAMSVFGMFAFWMWVVTARQVSALARRVAELEHRTEGSR